MNSFFRSGQATIEYIFILAFAILLGLALVSRFSEFFSGSMGSVSHVLSSHLTVGVCPRDCWFRGYYNSFSGEP